MFGIAKPHYVYLRSPGICCRFLLRTLIAGNKSRPPWRKKTTKMIGKPQVFEQSELPKGGTETSEILKRFLPPAPLTSEVPVSHKKSEDVIKASDLLKDFIGMTIKHTQSRNRPDLAKQYLYTNHTEPLPCSEHFPIKNLASERQTTVRRSVEETLTKEAFIYNNEVYNEVEALEAAAYRSKASNRFEELLLWTLEGKLWRYPIDNEQDWDSELATGFHEHVFLERLIDRKSEKPTPLTAFMELICAGLAQNPYIEAKQKQEHIQWFEAYFSTKVSQIESAVAEENRLSGLENKHAASE